MYKILLFTCLLSLTSFHQPPAEEERQPNIIIIFTDDQGYQDLGCFGSPDIQTPHLDQMAAEGIQLTSFYAAQAVCSASRAALLTGCYPNRLGVHGAFIDTLIARISGAKLPPHTIDGKDIWDIWTGDTTQSPQEAYYFYYHVNELHGIRYQNWKMYFPHKYRTLNGREGGKNGFPADYEYKLMEQIELYDLSKDISESSNVAAAYPEVVAQISLLADKIREELGDALLEKEGKGNRPIGIIE